jgi:hypothetical protein
MKLDRKAGSKTKVAFNKENPSELIRQLITVLTKAGLDDAVNQIKMKKIPALVNKAWESRNASTNRLAFLQGRRASTNRLAFLRGRLKLAGDLKGVLAKIFEDAQPFVKNWDRFLQDLSYDMAGLEFLETFSSGSGVVAESLTGSGWGGPATFMLRTIYEIDLNKFPKQMVKTNQVYVADQSGFEKAMAKVVKDSAKVQLLGKVLRAAFKYLDRGTELNLGFEKAIIDLEEAGGSLAYMDGLVESSLKGAQFKVQGSTLLVLAEHTVQAKVSYDHGDDPGYDEPDGFDDDDYREPSDDDFSRAEPDWNYDSPI